MRLFSRYTAWLNYAATQLAGAEVDEAEAEAAQKYEESSHMVLNWRGAQDKVTIARAEMALAPKVDKARKLAMSAYASRKMTAVVYANCERCVNLISREVTRRVGGRSERVQLRHDRLAT